MREGTEDRIEEAEVRKVSDERTIQQKLTQLAKMQLYLMENILQQKYCYSRFVIGTFHSSELEQHSMEC